MSTLQLLTIADISHTGEAFLELYCSLAFNMLSAGEIYLCTVYLSNQYTFWNVCKLERLVNLAPLAEIMSLTNQKHIFDLARLAVRSSLMLKSMRLLAQDWNWNRRKGYVFS